jgi:hypothetical protein
MPNKRVFQEIVDVSQIALLHLVSPAGYQRLEDQHHSIDPLTPDVILRTDVALPIPLIRHQLVRDLQSFPYNPIQNKDYPYHD